MIIEKYFREPSPVAHHKSEAHLPHFLNKLAYRALPIKFTVVAAGR